MKIAHGYAARAARRALAAAALAGLVACGSDNNPDAPAVREPLPVLSEDVLPTGARIDVRGDNYFPFANGDTWTYRFENVAIASVPFARTVTSGPDAGGALTVQETGLFGLRDIEYRVDANGVALATPLATVLATGGVTAGEQAIVGPLLEYPQPFYPVGAVRLHVRQGPSDVDFDLDGHPDSFRAEFSQVFRGFESIALPNGRATAQAAHFSNKLVYTRVPSNPAQLPSTTTVTEETWFAPGIGLVRLERADTFSGTVRQTQPIVIAGGAVGGQPLFADGTVRTVPLVHNALVYSAVRNRYYASVPGSVPIDGNRIAVIDPQTGAVTYSPLVGSDPGPLAVSPDGSTLYVGLKGAGAVVRMDTASLTVIDTLALPVDASFGPLFAGAISVSPLDPAVFVLTLQAPNFSLNMGLALVRNMALQPVRVPGFTGATAVAFATSGTEVVGADMQFSSFAPKRYGVLANGLVELQSTVGPGQPIGSSFEVSGGRLIVGQRVFGTADLVLAGTISAAGGGCRALPGGQRAVCFHSPVFGATETRLLVADLSTFVIGSTALVDSLAPPVSPLLREIVPGPPGQVAIHEIVNNSPVQTTLPARVLLFDSALLQ